MDGRPNRKTEGLLRATATRHSLYGVAIAFGAIALAVPVSAWMQTGTLSAWTMIEVLRTNAALWFLCAMSFVFPVGGQYVGLRIARAADRIVATQRAALEETERELIDRKREHEAAREELQETTRELQQRKRESEEAALKAQQAAWYDQLTGLPNRILLQDRAEQALRGAVRTKEPVVLILLDMNRFKDVNDTLGHDAGDRLLKQVAVRLREVVRASDTLARMGGDEFAVLLPAVAQEEDIGKVMEKIGRAFEEPFLVADMRLDMRASAGIAVSPRHGNVVDALMQRAEVAMYAAKDAKQAFQVYDESLNRNSSKRLSLLTQLREAIARDELVLHYQPKVRARDLAPCGAEALVRWRHPVFGVVPPDEFIQLAEQTGLIQDLSRWVLRKAVEQGARWASAGRTLGIAVNISPSTLLDPDFPEFIAGLCAAHDLPHGTLTLEVTESSLLRDPQLALGILRRLAELGSAISIDDFGTGYSSLSYLKRMPASELKIDKSFVMDMLDNSSDAAIVRATVDLAHNLGLSVVAEGVENEAALAALAALGCDTLQGYLFSRPLPADAFDAWLADYRPPVAPPAPAPG